MTREYFNEDCLFVYDTFGETIIQNTCTYNEVRILWDFGQWLSFFAVIVAFFVIVINLVSLFDGE